MNPFKRFLENKQIQATNVEGAKSNIALESLLSGERINSSISGTENSYKEYNNQVRETYRKYNGRTDFGVSQVRAVVDIRTAMIAGEGISIASTDDRLTAWIEKFLTDNEFISGSSLHNSVKGGEMSGQSLFFLKTYTDENGETSVKAKRMPYDAGMPYRPLYNDPIFKDEVTKMQLQKKDGDKITCEDLPGDFIYVRTGGDDGCFYGATTKIGVVLTDCENYDRAIKDMRRNNHITARVTPVFQTENEQDAKKLAKSLNETKWKIGKSYAGSAKFEYVSPKNGAHENLKTEMVGTIKNIVATTSVPVHWLGYTDLMSNRSTADSLYEMIKHGTSIERAIWERSFYNMIIKAQEMYIDAGGTDISKINTDFQVRLPLLDFSDFKDRISALSLAFSDTAISMEDYRNAIPGIDPLKTKKAVEEEQEEEGIDNSAKIEEMTRLEEEDEQANNGE